MKTVTVTNVPVLQIIEIVHQMKAHGWVDKVDFDWAFYKAENFSEPAYCYTIFNFYKEEYSTYFALRWL